MFINIVDLIVGYAENASRCTLCDHRFLLAQIIYDREFTVYSSLARLIDLPWFILAPSGQKHVTQIAYRPINDSK